MFNGPFPCEKRFLDPKNLTTEDPLFFFSKLTPPKKHWENELTEKCLGKDLRKRGQHVFFCSKIPTAGYADLL